MFTDNEDFIDTLLNASNATDPLDAALGVGVVMLRARECIGPRFSVRAVERDPRCTLPRRTLRTYLAVAEQWEVLGEELGRRLPLSQHVELLPVKAAEKKIALALRAADESWTVKQLRFHAAEWADGNDRPVHRARLRQLAKKATAAASASTKLLEAASAQDSIEKLDPHDAERVAEDLERCRDSISALAQRLRASAAQQSRSLDRQRRRATAPHLGKYDRLKHRVD